jgi:hypothetical protein
VISTRSPLEIDKIEAGVNKVEELLKTRLSLLVTREPCSPVTANPIKLTNDAIPPFGVDDDIVFCSSEIKEKKERR